jgi:hypothetical protein
LEETWYLLQLLQETAKQIFSAVMMHSCWMFELMETNIDPSVWSEWRTLAAQKDRKLGIGAQGAWWNKAKFVKEKEM